MIKWLGVVAGAVACFLLGSSCAMRLKEQLDSFHTLEKLLLRFSKALSLRRMPTKQLLSEAAAAPEFACFLFLKEAAANFDGSQPLEQLWGEAVEKQKPPLPTEGQEILLEIGRILGNGSWEDQAAALELLKSRLEPITVQAGERMQRESRLFRSLGGLAGLLLAVLAL